MMVFARSVYEPSGWVSSARVWLVEQNAGTMAFTRSSGLNSVCQFGRGISVYNCSMAALARTVTYHARQRTEGRIFGADN